VKSSKPELSWQPGTYSDSPYKPYWKIEADGYAFYVTQGGSVYNEEKMSQIIYNLKKGPEAFVNRYHAALHFQAAYIRGA